MTPEEFREKWRGTTRTERSAAHEHFLDLCDVLGVPKPQEILARLLALNLERAAAGR